MANHETHLFKEVRLPFILHLDFCPEQDYRGSNWHDNVEILWIRSGHGFVLCDGQEISLEAGDIFVVNAGLLHAFRCASSARDFFYDCLIVDNSFFEESGLPVTKMRFTPFLRDVAMQAAMQAVRDAWQSTDSLRIARVRCAVLSLICHLCTHHLAGPLAHRAEDNPPVKRAIRYMEAHYAEPISLCDVATALNLSRYHLAHLFRRATGLSVVAYLKNLRCRHARELLLQNELSTAQIAQACGFSSVPYFTRCFSQLYGCGPSQLRRSGTPPSLGIPNASNSQNSHD